MRADSTTSALSGGDTGHPFPELVRPAWCVLSGGLWDFAYDDDDVGRQEGWYRGSLPLGHTITVPFPPESKASGIGDPGFHPVVWYRRTVTRAEVEIAGLGTQGEVALLHFGAVDYRCQVWWDGQLLGQHEGGHTPFSFPLPPLVSSTSASWSLVVRAEDDPRDVAQPRGKQDWKLEPHGVWYARTTGIWQPVWLEAVPRLHVSSVGWVSDVPRGGVRLDLEFSERPISPVWVSVRLRYGGEVLAEARYRQPEPRSETWLSIPHQGNGQAYEALLWSPEHPRLIEAEIEIAPAAGTPDRVASYLGLRAAGWADGHFLLNDRPYYLRGVLEQGYWPESHLAAPSDEALREEVQLIKDLGFNFVRVHEKVEDPRFLFWADRLGLLVWGESASSFEFSITAVERMSREWLEVVRRDRSHPSVITWVPFNESWGVQHLAHDPAQLSYARALYHLTKAVDPTRPVISNDGWEQVDSDLWTVHDYGTTHDEVAANYATPECIRDLLAGVGPLGRRMRLIEVPDTGQPVVVSEFGGISYAASIPERAWGYVNVAEAEAFERALRELFSGVQTSPVLAGFCYTQLTDTRQEANGLTDPYRRPKLPVGRIRSIVLGEGLDLSSHRRPKRAPELPALPPVD